MKGMPNYTMPCLFLICVLPLMVQAQQVQHQKQAPAWLKRSRESASAKTMVTAVGKGRTRSEALSDVESKLAERIWSGIDLNEQQRKEYENLLRQEGAPLRNTLALLSTAADYRGLSLLRNQAVPDAHFFLYAEYPIKIGPGRRSLFDGFNEYEH